MAETICAPDAPPSAPTLATMAVAAGAAIFAGAVLGRRGLPGIAAGMAFIAGAKWLRQSGDASLAPPQDDEISTTEDLSPEVQPPEVQQWQPDAPDWLEHDAVDFSHVVPDSDHAMELLQEKALPLLDDDGLPVDSVVVLPDFPEPLEPASPQPVAREPDPPPGPIIWKPGRFPLSSCNGTSATVWFGAQDATPAPRHDEMHAPAPPAAPWPAAVSQHIAAHADQTPPPAAASPGGYPPWPPLAPSTPPVLPAADTPAFSAPQAPLPFGGNPFFSVPGDLQEAPAPVAPTSVSEFPAAGGLQPWGAPFAPSSAVAGPALITPRAAPKSLLPQPRRPGELPKGTLPGRATGANRPLTDEPPPEDWHAPPASLSHPRGVLRPEGIPPPGGHLEAMDGADPPSRYGNWPLLLLLALLVLIGLFLAVDQWQGGALTRRLQRSPTLQKQVEGERTAAALPPDRAEAPPSDAPKPGSWLNAAPEPGK